MCAQLSSLQTLISLHKKRAQNKQKEPASFPLDGENTHRRKRICSIYA